MALGPAILFDTRRPLKRELRGESDQRGKRGRFQGLVLGQGRFRKG